MDMEKMRKIVLLFSIVLLGAGCSDDNQTQMVIGAANNDTKCINHYLDSGHDVNGHGKEEASPFYAALRNKNFGIADIFVQHHVDLYGSSGGKSYLALLIEDKNYDAIKYLFSVGYKISPDAPEYGLAKKMGDKKILKIISYSKKPKGSDPFEP